MTKVRPIFIIAGTLLIVFAISLFLIKPTVSAVWSGWKALDTSEQNLKNAQERSSAIAELKKNKEQITNVSAIAEKYIPKKYDSSQLVLELTAIAQANSLTVQETSMENSAEAKTAPKDEVATPTP